MTDEAHRGSFPTLGSPSTAVVSALRPFWNELPRQLRGGRRCEVQAQPQDADAHESRDLLGVADNHRRRYARHRRERGHE
jgi:hypothetical protein